MKKRPTAPVERHIGLAVLLLSAAAIAVWVLYAALETHYPDMIIMYGMSAYEPDPFERGFLFWYSGLAMAATVGITLGLALLLPGRIRQSDASAQFPRRAYLLVAAAFVLILAAKFLVLHNSQTMDDEHVYHFSARLLSQGRLTLASPVPEEFFAKRWGIYFLNGQLCPMFPYGWPALLSIGYLVRAPWLINPLLALGVMLLAAQFALRVYGARTAMLTLLLFLVSPFFILTSATDLSLPMTALGTLMVVLFAQRYMEDGRIRWLWLCGAGGGIAFSARQLNAVSLLTPFFLYLLFYLWKQRGILRAAALVAPVLVAAALYLTTNYVVNGDPLRSGYSMTAVGNPLGFGRNFGVDVGGAGVHTVSQGILNSGFNLIRLNTWLLGWPLSLLPVFAARFNLWTRLILVALGLELLAYVVFFNPGLCLTGPTYFFDSGTLLLILAADGIRRLGAWYRSLPVAIRAPRAEGALITAIVVVSLVMFVPTYVRSLYHMTEGTSLLPRTLEMAGVHNAVVFVKNVQAPFVPGALYNSFSYGPRTNASFDDDVVILNDLGAEKNRNALRRFPGRKGYVYAVDSAWKAQITPFE